jgi:WD40 repeat protein
MRGFTFVYLVVGLILTVQGGILKAESETEKVKEKIARLIKQLGDDSFRRREAASKQLKDIGEPAREALEEAVTNSGDIEIRQRARRLLQALPPKFLLRTICAKGLAIHALAISPNGKHLAASGGFMRNGDDWVAGTDYDVHLFDRATGKEVRRLAVGDRHAGIPSFSPDGKLLAATATGEQSRIFVWDVASGKVVHELKGHDYVLSTVTFSPDGKRLLSCGWDRTIRLWDVTKGEEVRQLGQGGVDWSEAVFLPDGKQAIACGITQGRAALVRLDVETGEVLRAFQWGRGRLTTLSLSPDGKRLLTTCAAEGGDGRARLWAVESGELVRVFAIPEEEVVTVPRYPHGSAIRAAFLPDGRRFVMVCNKSMHLCDAETGVLLQTFRNHTDAALAVAVSGKGAFAASAGLDETVNLWRLPERDHEKR